MRMLHLRCSVLYMSNNVLRKVILSSADKCVQFGSSRRSLSYSSMGFCRTGNLLTDQRSVAFFSSASKSLASNTFSPYVPCVCAIPVAVAMICLPHCFVPSPCMTPVIFSIHCVCARTSPSWSRMLPCLGVGVTGGLLVSFGHSVSTHRHGSGFSCRRLLVS